MSEEAPQEVMISKCDACKAVVIGFEAGLIIGGAIILIPEEATIAGVVLGLTALGLMVGKDQLIAWIKEAAEAGIKTIVELAAYICKKAGACS